MNILKNVFFGLLSGLTGFLPVSISAHQNLYCMMTGMEDNPLLRLFIYLGCLIAVIVHYNKMLKHMQREMRIAGAKKHRRLRQPDLSAVSIARVIITSSVPIALGTVFGRRLAAEAGQLWLMSILLIVNGALMYAMQFMQPGQKDGRNLSPMDGVIYGSCNALSVIPGISGISCVLIAGQSRGADRGFMLDLAMLLMIPWLCCAIVLELIAMIGVTGISLLLFFSAILSAGAAFGGAYSAISLLRYLAVRIGFHGFAYYSWGAGLVCLILYLMV